MKKMLLMAVMMAIALSARAMSYMDARNEALFLSDKMAYEMNLSMSQFDAVYEINFDYFYMVNQRSEVNGKYWRRRNSDMKYVLSTVQYNYYRSVSYFYRPLGWSGNALVYNVYSHYRNRNHLYYELPSVFDNYRGGHSNSSGSYYSGRTFDNGRRPSNFDSRGGNYVNWRQNGNSNGKNLNNQGGTSWHIGNQNNNQGGSIGNGTGNGQQNKNGSASNSSRSGQGNTVKFGSNASKSNIDNSNKNTSNSSRSNATSDSDKSKNDNSKTSTSSQRSGSSVTNNSGTFGGRRK